VRLAVRAGSDVRHRSDSNTDGCKGVIILGFMLIARRYLIAGRVQGVGFRFFVEHHAAVEGLHGWVRNLPDGRVEVRLEGDGESVERVEAALGRGPAGARVEAMTVDDEAPTGRATGFAIR
jgi:acylphosphatase